MMRIYSLEARRCYLLVVYKEISHKMKKIMIAALGLSLLSGSVVLAQNASTDSSSTTKKKVKHKKGKKGETSSTEATTATK